MWTWCRNMKTIKINFTSFWPDFDPTNNIFINILKKRYIVEISDNPDILFFSCFGGRHRKHNKALKIFFTGENIRPNFWKCDYSISFDYDSYKGRNFRWPLYNLFYDPKKEPAKKQKTKFACIVISRSTALRTLFFNTLSKVKQVDSGGRWHNTVGGPVKDKMEFISDYKFCFAFENTSYPGYVTEKLMQAKLGGCVPIYWGHTKVNEDFNTNSYIDLNNFENIDAFIKEIIALDADEKRYNKMLNEPLLPNNTYTKYSNIENLENWLYTIIEKPKKKRPRNIFIEKFVEFLNNIKTKKYNDKIERKFLQEL